MTLLFFIPGDMIKRCRYGDKNYEIGTYTRSLIRNKQGVTFQNLTKVPENVFLKSYWAFEKMRGWRTYSWGNLKFYYPPGWQVRSETYTTAGEMTYTASLSVSPAVQESPADSITIGGRQIDCALVRPPKYHCWETNGGTPVYTMSGNQKILEVFNLLINTAEELTAFSFDTSSWKTYRNEQYGFEFRYPSDAILKEGGRGTYFRFTKPIVSLERLLTIGLTDYIQKDTQSGAYTLQVPTDVIRLPKDCTEPFFGNTMIPHAKMSFGDGGDWSVLYNIALQDGKSFGIETYHIDVDFATRLLRGEEKEIKKREIERAEAQQTAILQRLTFLGSVKPVKFVCRNFGE